MYGLPSQIARHDVSTPITYGRRGRGKIPHCGGQHDERLPAPGSCAAGSSAAARSAPPGAIAAMTFALRFSGRIGDSGVAARRLPDRLGRAVPPGGDAGGACGGKERRAAGRRTTPGHTPDGGAVSRPGRAGDNTRCRRPFSHAEPPGTPAPRTPASRHLHRILLTGSLVPVRHDAVQRPPPLLAARARLDPPRGHHVDHLGEGVAKPRGRTARVKRVAATGRGPADRAARRSGSEVSPAAAPRRVKRDTN